MADPEHLAKLKEGVDAWNEWRKESPRTPDLSDARLSGICLVGALLNGANLAGAHLRGATLSEVDLVGADLSNACLTGADFRSANLHGSDLSGATCDGANLETANCEGANLTGANLNDSNLNGANLEKARAQDASLRNADLRCTKMSTTGGLAARSFGGSNLAGAVLPPGLEFHALDTVEASSKNCRTLFFGVLATCAYCGIAVATTTDASLVLRLGSFTLPIIGTDVDARLFYPVASWLLWGVFAYLQIYLQRLWDRISSLPAVFEDGRRLDEVLYPWLLVGLVRYRMKWLEGVRVPFSWLELAASVFLVWLAVPATLGWMYYRTLVVGDLRLTRIQGAACLVTIAMTYMFLRRAMLTLSGGQVWRSTAMRKVFGWHLVSPDMWRGFCASRVCAAGLAALLVFAAATVSSEWLGPKWWRTARVVQYEADLRGLTISEELPLVAAELPAAKMQGCVFAPGLRHDLSRANLVQANLRSANLASVVLHGARLVDADMDECMLAEAKLRYGDLRRAKLRSANLNRADLTGATLVDADLTGANLTKADLTGANLTKADLTDAHLMHAGLRGANLEGANLSRAQMMRVDLTQASLWRANLTRAVMIGADLRRAKLGGADLTRAIMKRAQLSGADLRSANLARASLNEANLSNVDLSNANLSNANLSKADLTGANLTGANLSKTDLSETKLSGANLTEAIYDHETEAPPPSNPFSIVVLFEP